MRGSVFFCLSMVLASWADAQTLSGASQQPLVGYGLKLESTVGVGNTCYDDKLALPPGVHDLMVCLHATNTGNGNLVMHEVVSEQLGGLVNGEFYTLAPGESVNYTYAVSVSQSVGLVSRWVGYSEFGQSACAIAWSVVVVGESIGGVGATDPAGTLLCPFF